MKGKVRKEGRAEERILRPRKGGQAERLRLQSACRSYCEGQDSVGARVEIASWSYRHQMISSGHGHRHGIGALGCEVRNHVTSLRCRRGIADGAADRGACGSRAEDGDTVAAGRG